MKTYRLEIDHLADRFDIRTDLGRADPDCQLAAFVGLGTRLGYELDLAKATGKPKAPDPRYPQLEILRARAAELWTRWTGWLLDGLLSLLSPSHGLAGVNRVLVNNLLEDFRAGAAASFAGEAAPGDEARVKALEESGLVEPAAAPLPIAFDAGANLVPTEPHPIPTPPTVAPTFAEVARAERRAVRSGPERAAVDYARQKGAIYMRAPAEGVGREVQRLLTEDEYRRIRHTIARGVAEGRSWKQLASDLREATAGTRLTNDMDRVARTELAAAYHHGAYVALKAKAGNTDPLVYKIARPDCCDDCRRIWGPTRDPKVYRLSELEKNDAAGGNWRLPHAQWVPTTGPTHPNCVCSPLLIWHPSIRPKVEAASTALREMFG